MRAGALAAWELSNLLLWLAGLAALLAGATVVGVAVHRPGWVIGVVVAVLLIMLFAEGSFRQWRSAETERVRLDLALHEEHSAEAIAERFEGFAREFELLKLETVKAPDDGFLARQAFTSSALHLAERIRTEIRLNAPNFADYWMTNPDPMPPADPFHPYVECFADFSVEQLNHIAARLRSGHSEP